VPGGYWHGIGIDIDLHIHGSDQLPFDRCQKPFGVHTINQS
jgi:hypothetical protein